MVRGMVISTTNIAELDKENNTILTGHHSRYGFRMGAPCDYYNVLEGLIHTEILHRP